MFKTHTCGELRPQHDGFPVELAGWVHRYRTHGGINFIDLRDRFGIVQIVSNPMSSPEAHKIAEDVRFEWVIQVKGVVHLRPQGLENPNLSTGEIEVEAKEIKVLNQAKSLPFMINRDEEIDEQTRLHFRYLDLRRERMRGNLALRHRVVKFIRDYLDDKGFLEIETPILFKTTPEGARDYLVPSRVHPGEFYALPQSPQQLKQMLMVGGIERYFQIARCFRDEDQRGDRQPEFTQLDLEMSFVEREDIMNMVEEMFTRMVSQIVPNKHLLASPWPRMTYREAMDRFGKDNPDIRYGMELKNITELAGISGFQVFEKTVNENGQVRGINAKGLGDYSRKQIEELTEFVKQYGAKGLAYLAITSDGEQRSSFAKFIKTDILEKISTRLAVEPGDLLLFIADRPAVVYESLGQVAGHAG